MKKIIIIFLFFSLSFTLFSVQNVSSKFTIVRLYIDTGLTYHFPFTTDWSSQEASLFLDIPVRTLIDIRKHDRVSFLTGLEINYGINYQQLKIDELTYKFYTHSLFIRVPIMLKVYPLVYKHEAYYNFYFAVGGLIQFWPLQRYYITTEDANIHSGNSYIPKHDELPPGNIYSFVNPGIKFALGNHFYVRSRLLLGVEFFTHYLILPSINGYYFGENYNRGYDVIMEFDLAIGLVFSVGITLFE